MLPELAAEEALAPPSCAMAADDRGEPSGGTPSRGFYTAEELSALERRNLVAVLEKTEGRVAGVGGAADLLGVKPSTLTYQIKTLHITRR